MSVNVLINDHLLKLTLLLVLPTALLNSVRIHVFCYVKTCQKCLNEELSDLLQASVLVMMSQPCIMFYNRLF